MLPKARAADYQQFMHEYSIIRQAEGRGSENPAYYRALPFSDLTGRRSGEWAIRGRSFQTLVERVIQPLEVRSGQPLRILDLGAGNGWLSNRLAGRGNHLAAIDLLTDALDGLAAHINYENLFVPIQAEFDRLPFMQGLVDLVIFNSSFHYSSDYGTTLSEALRVIIPAGKIIILDTPIYSRVESGAQMVQERQKQFERLYGFPSDAIPSENYLTYERVKELGGVLGIHWEVIFPEFGLRWALRPLIARLRGRREPAQFAILIGERR